MSEDSETYGDQSVDDEDQLQPGDTLDDTQLDDVLDRGYSPPDRPPTGYDDYPTAAEQRAGETFAQRLAQEEPEVDPYADEVEGDRDALPRDVDYDRVAERRAGRLVQPDQGFGEDVSSEEIAVDVGIDGAGASAEEAAVHVIEDAEVDYDDQEV
jgi:hypothetical protein